MRRTYQTLAVMAALATVAALLGATLNLDLIFPGLWPPMLILNTSGVSYLLTASLIAQVCALFVTVTLALAVVTAAWTGNRNWLVALSIASALAVYWLVIVQLVRDISPFVMFWSLVTGYVVGSILIVGLAPLAATILALSFAARGARAGSVGVARQPRRAHVALAVAAALAIVVNALAPAVIAALQFGRVPEQGYRGSLLLKLDLAQAMGATHGGLTVGVVVAGVCVAAWLRRRSWLTAIAATGALAYALPIAAAVAFVFPDRASPAPLAAYNTPITQAALAALPCALALVFAIVCMRREPAVAPAA